MSVRRRAGFTLIEILISMAILGILFTLMFRPLMMGIEVLSIARSERRAQAQAESVAQQLETDLQAAYKVYPNLAVFDLTTGGGATAAAKWRTQQPSRLDLVLPQRTASGAISTPVRPATDAAGNPQVVTYWLMRDDPTGYYDPELNPRRVFRAVYAYPATSVAAGSGTVALGSPDDLWDYVTQTMRDGTGETFATLGDNLAPLFAPGGAFDWFVKDLDRLNPAAGARIMRGPQSGAAYTNATRIQAVEALTDRETDVRQFSLLPARSDEEELPANGSFTAYRGQLGRWVPPYQRDDGTWTMAAGDNLGGLPVAARFTAAGARSSLLTTDYFIAVDANPGSATVGHPVLYRWDGAAAVAVYDLAEYPKRVFADTPGNAASAEFACGINWATGEIITVFPQRDVIDVTTNPADARLHALNDGLLETASYASLAPGRATNFSDEWLSLPLTYRESDNTLVSGVNGAELDEYQLDAPGVATGVWSSYTLSAFRPERLRTGTDKVTGGQGLAVRQLDMAVVPGSARVQVSYGGVWRTYTPVGSVGELGLNRYLLDSATGELRFYDPAFDADAQTGRDGFNPPLAGARIFVTYEYRNNLPDAADAASGNLAGRDLVVATYRSTQQIELKLTVDAPTTSSRGGEEILNDPLAQAAVDRPTGSRRRVVVQRELRVGGAR